MTQNEKQKIEKTLSIIAAQEGRSVAHIRRSIQASIDDAWNRSWVPGNIKAQAAWQILFPGGKKPTVEEFIAVMSKKIAAGEDIPQLK